MGRMERWRNAAMMSGILMLSGCGGGNADDPAAGDEKAVSPPATMPAMDEAPTATPDITPESVVDDGLAAIGDAMDTATDKADDVVNQTSAKVQGWIDDFNAKIEGFQTQIDSMRMMVEKSSKEDLQLLFGRVELAVSELTERVKGMSEVSEIEATARKFGLDQLQGDIENMIIELKNMLG